MTPPGQVWSSWNADPLVIAGLLALGWGYARGVERLWRRAGRGAVVSPWQARAFAAGWVTVALALLSPLDALAHTLFSAHMVQHLLLVLVAAPLLAFGAPLTPVLHALGRGLRSRVHRLRPSAAWRRRLGGPVAVSLAVTAHIAVLWVWHLPALYTAALTSTVVHALEHATMLGTALLLWSMLVSTTGPVRRASPAGALAMFAVATLTVGLGAILTFTPGGLYPAYSDGALSWGFDLVEDQQLGGAIMWTVGGIVYTAAGAGLLGWWLVSDQRRRARVGGR